MFENFFRPRTKAELMGEASEARLARIESGRRIYCIGDVHGRADLLGQVVDFIAKDLRDASGPTHTILLGDYIDRGPDSAAVLERLSKGEFPTEFTALLGNHERMLLDFFERANVLETWRRQGALETLRSYGVPLADVIRGGKYAEAQAALRGTLPERHLTFLQGRPLAAQSRDYYFCHAGVRPHVALAQQKEEDLLWIRTPFLNFAGSFGKIVVHGHSRVRRPEIRANRINIDTGAFATGALSCLILEKNKLRIFSTSDPGA
jgi:serine/threonine protein phosphatase 1